ncbi:TetR family transcriptional regulator [Gordonia sp. X0973]|uniref:TetR/AcrR family transcriptional regulator n=1 Tax=Gordonia sp. X0973 TaxID=2742602 RepID=UPI000F53AB0D|nr:TetR/AcrR family transcriptional regulator [Gordonia sp. X0973]QKT06059.1 TetR family transcriptional regulator [Gordonia sp. X0973]
MFAAADSPPGPSKITYDEQHVLEPVRAAARWRIAVTQMDSPASRRPIGRPPKTAERKAQCFAAVTEIVAKDGLASVTVSNVAAAAGLTRTLVGHYFSTRDNLISEYVSLAVDEFGRAMIAFASERSVNEAVVRMLDDDAYGDEKYVTVWLELVATSSRDVEIRKQLNTLWQKRWLPSIERRIAAEYPSAHIDKVREVAFCTTALVEAYWALRAQLTGDTSTHRAQIMNGCHQLLAQLGPPSLPASA